RAASLARRPHPRSQNNGPRGTRLSLRVTNLRRKNAPCRLLWRTEPRPETLPTAPQPQASPPTWARVGESTITANPVRKSTRIEGNDDVPARAGPAALPAPGRKPSARRAAQEMHRTDTLPSL